MNAVNPSVATGGDAAHDAPRPRRERLRAATEAEIVETARVLLLEGGPDALTLREVGRRMGMTASALYRYVEGHAGLVDRLTAAFFAEATEAMRAELSAGGPRTDDGPAGPGGEEQVARNLVAVATAFRRWSTSHPAEFALMYGPGEGRDPGCVRAAAAGEQFGRVFLDLFVSGLTDVHAPPTGCADVFAGLPAPLDSLFARSWARLLGLVMFEVAGQYEAMGLDADAVFTAEAASCAEMVLQGRRQVQQHGSGPLPAP